MAGSTDALDLRGYLADHKRLVDTFDYIPTTLEDEARAQMSR